MPKRIKHRKQLPKDVNQWARAMVDRSTAEPREVTDDEVSRVMAAIGRKGGLIGGKRRLETMTFEQRSAIGLKAAQTRWKRAKRATKG